MELLKDGHSDGQKEDTHPHKDNIIVLLEKEMLMEELFLKLILELALFLESLLLD